jgi:hypothetical protein
MEQFVHRYHSDAWGVFFAVLMLLLGSAGVARAQFASEATPQEVPGEQTVNLFVQWKGGAPIDGLFATLPSDWQLEDAVALQSDARRVPLSVRPSREGEDEYFLGAEETLRSATTFILRVRTASAAGGAARWSVEPFSYRAEQRLRRLSRYRTERRVDLTRSTTSEQNRVLSFQEAAQPLLLDRTRLSALSTRAPFTVETWIKTTGLGEVVLSTWDGVAQHPYPLELVVGPGGRLRYYRGRPGRHESMATPRPVADGAWHHVAVTNDPQTGRAHLLLDGEAVDSLRGTVPLESRADVVGLGGRVPAPRAEGEAAAQPGGFTGELDEVHFWPQARRTEDVRRTMRQPRPDAPNVSARQVNDGETGPVLLHFEGEEWPGRVVVGTPEGVARRRSDLRFYAPISALRARTPGEDVSLSWTAPGRGAFVIERSTDDDTFREVGRREARAGTERYAFTDDQATGEVVYYRIRQAFDGGVERLSGTIKVGRAPAETQEGVTLMGNFPNPFSESTTVAYQVHSETRVRLAVWDLTGQRVTMLVDKTQSPGYKEVAFRPEGLSSGTYFVRLRANGQTHTRKIALVK